MPAASLRSDPPRSLLFVPADRAMELLPKADASGADALILDLEDAVRPERRAEARTGLGEAYEATRPRRPVFVRVDHPRGAGFSADLEVVARLPGAGIVLPKCDDPDDVRRLVRAWSELTANELVVVALAETARGVLAAAEIAAADPAVIGLAFGAEDLAAEVGFRRTGPGREILVARSLVVLGAAAAGRWAVDTPCLEIDAQGVVSSDARRAARLGFAGKLVVHPGQVAPVNAAFRPTAAEVERARRTIDAASALEAAGRGVGVVDGRMIDRPLVEAARRLIAQAARSAEQRGEG